MQISVIELHRIAEYLNKPIAYFFGEDYFGEGIQALIAEIWKMPPEIRKEQVAFIRTMLLMQELSDGIDSQDNLTHEEQIKYAKTALSSINLQIDLLKNQWDQAQIAKKQFEEIIGIDDIESK